MANYCSCTAAAMVWPPTRPSATRSMPGGVSGSESSVRPRRRRRRDRDREDGRPGRLGQRWRLAWPDRLLDRVGRQPRFGGRAREGLPGPRDRRRSRRLRSDRDVAGAWGAGSARTAGPEPDRWLRVIDQHGDDVGEVKRDGPILGREIRALYGPTTQKIHGTKVCILNQPAARSKWRSRSISQYNCMN